MNKTIVVKEETYHFWKIGAIILAILAVITFMVYLYVGDPFWNSIIRLAAFVFFALAILSYLQIMNGPIEIKLGVTVDDLMVTYKKNGKTIQEEQFQRETIKEIFTSRTGINFILAKLKPNIKTFRIKFTDTEQQLFLFEFSGRPLLFGKSARKKINSFFQEQLTDELSK